MKALLVGDNRSGLNWGGRGVSIALRQLFCDRVELLESVRGNELSLASVGLGYVGTYFPRHLEWVFLFMLANRRQRWLYDALVRLQEALGARDFVARNPAETAANILRYRSSNAGISRLYDRIVAADIVLINGEGDIVFTTPPRREVLFMMGVMELALRLGKRVSLINSMLSDCPDTGRNTETVANMAQLLQRCEAVVLRDKESLAYLAEICPRVIGKLVPDALFEFGSRVDSYLAKLPAFLDLLLPFPNDDVAMRVDLSQPYLCIGGSASAALDSKRAIVAFSRLVNQLRELGMQIVLTQNDGRDAFLREVAIKTGSAFVPVETSIYAATAILGNARAFVSGRYHPSIMASLGGTPCVFLGSTAHKMSSVQSILGYETVRQFSCFPDEDECLEILGFVRKYLDAGFALRQHIKSIARSRACETNRLSDVVISASAQGETRLRSNVVRTGLIPL